MPDETTSRYDIPLKDWKMADLVAELELYQKAGSITEEMVTTLTNNDKRYDAIKSLRDTVGEPYIVTEEDAKVNPMLKIGDIIIVPVEADKSTETTNTSEPGETTDTTAASTDPATGADTTFPADTSSSAPIAAGMNVGETREPVAAVGPGGKLRPENVQEKPKQLYFGGKPVLTTLNKLNNGKIYVEVCTTESSHLLSEEEFKDQVTERING